jgi:signal transduction histidine kinase
MENAMQALKNYIWAAEPLAWLKLAIGGSILIPAIFVIIVVIQAYQSAKDGLLQSLNQTAETAYEVVNDTLQLQHALVEPAEALLRSHSAPGSCQALHNELARLTDGISEYAVIRIYTLDGDFVASSEATTGPGTLKYNGPVPPIGEIGIDDVRFLNWSQPNVINFTRQFIDPDKPKNNNLIVITINPNFFQVIGKDQRIGAQIITLRKSDGRIVMRIPNADPLRFTPKPTAFAEAVAERADHGTFHVTGFQEGVQRLGLYKQIKGWDLYVVVTTPDVIGISQWARFAAPYVAFLIALGVLGAAISWVALRQAKLATEQSRVVEQERSIRDQFVDVAHAKGRYELLSVISAGIAHHFNNILATLNISHELIELRANAANIRTALDAAIAASERGKLLVRHLQAFSLNLPIKPQVINLKDVFPEIIEALRTTVFNDSEVTVTLDLELGVGDVEVDPTEFRFALFNIASNSKEYMQHGGVFKTELKTMRFIHPGFQVGDDRIEGLYACISLEDNGSGISPENIDKVFTPFFTTKDVGDGGGGLGLSHVYGFVKSCNGAISVESKVNVGTTIRIYLPMRR